MNPQAAIVILNYNGRGLLARAVESARRQSLPAEIVVADNGSTDGSLEALRQAPSGARLLDLGRNWGFAEGYNRALAEVRQPWLALLNNDAALAPDWLEVLLQAAGREPRAAILGGKLLFQPEAGGGPAVVQSAGARFTDSGAAFEIGWGQPDRGQYDRPARVGSIPGAALLIRRAAWEELGGFDGRYFAYLEDVDLCWRAWLAGHEVHCVPAAVAHHHFGASGGGRASAFRIRLMQRNRLATMLKNLEAASLPAALAVSLAYDAYRLLEFAARRHVAGMSALASGTLAFLRDLRPTLDQRAGIQRGRRLSDGDLRSQGLLVSAWEAFREYRRLGRLALSWKSS